jgi:hypothetical protein
MSGTGFRIVQSIYWLSLGTWFGAMVMIFLAARSSFAVLPPYQPSIGAPPYNHPALADVAPRILAGAVNGAALRKLGVLQLICAATVVLCVLLQCTSGSAWLERGGRHWANYLRIGLIVLPIAILSLDALALERRIHAQRDVIYNPNLSPEQRVRERATFGKLHGISMLLATTAALSLMGAILVSSFAFLQVMPFSGEFRASDPALKPPDAKGAARG